MLRSRLDLENKRFYVTGKGNKERVCFLTPRAKYELKKYLDTRTDDSPYVCFDYQKHFRTWNCTVVHYGWSSYFTNSVIFAAGIDMQ